MTNPYINLLHTAWKYARTEKKKYVMVYAMLVGANAIYSLNPILFGWFIGSLQKDTANAWRYALIYAGSYVAIRLLQWCLHGPARIMERSLAFSLSRNFLQERYHQVLHLPVRWQQDHHSGATINRVRKAYEALREFFDRGFMYIFALTKFLFSVAAMLWFSPLFGSIAICLGILTIIVIRAFDRPFVKAIEEVNEREHVLSATLFDSLSNIMTVITLRLEKSMEKGLLQKAQRIFRPFRRSALINEWKWFCAEMMIVIIYGIITLGYIYQHWEPGRVFLVGSLVTLLAYVNQFTSVFQDMAWQYTEIVQFNTYVETAAEIDKAYKTMHRPDLPAGLPRQWELIEIRELNFSHQSTNLAGTEWENVQRLIDIGIRISRGQRIALIGRSGSGKSTLLSLLRGLYLPEPGLRLTIDGQSFTSAQPGGLERVNESVTLFPQEPEIFENTLAYNITLGLPFPEEEVLEACESAYFMEVVRQLPQGLQTDIREKGVNLSGGQKQRLALARGILAARDSDLILLDEPTSSVDPRTEALIYEGMFQAFADKAIISSMHRLHLLRHFDHVYVMEGGRIVAEGSFEQLRHDSIHFQELWRHQEQGGE